MSQDLEHLRLLSIFHYVVGGLLALFACLPFIHFFLGLAMASGVFEHTEPGVRLIGAGIMVFAGLFILAGWILAACLVVAGRNLARRRRYTFCLVVAGVSCVFMPFGTVLGVFTIIVLSRPTVKEMFNAQRLSPVPQVNG
jgi:hypothetical protein